MLNGKHAAARGFTVIELIVVLAVIGLLLAIAAPRYVQHIDRAREVALRQDLQQVRVAIDQFHADQMRDPASLEELVKRGYLHAVPVDPITDSTQTWKIEQARQDGGGTVFEIHSGATGQATDGSAYADW